MKNKPETDQINTATPIKNDGVLRQPNERDEAPDQNPSRPPNPRLQPERNAKESGRDDTKQKKN